MFPTIWFKDCKTEEEKERLIQTLKGSSFLMNKIKEIIEIDEQALSNTELSLTDFNEPNWSEKQAFRNGARSVYRKMRLLLTP